MSLKVLTLGFGVAILCVTSSCTSKSKDASTQNENVVVISSDPLENLKNGNERFLAGKPSQLNRDSLRVKELIAGQNPQAIVVTCSDSRVSPEIVFDQGLGDIFTIRTAGNVMDDYEEGSIEYAVEHIGSKLIVVMGHTHCGAIHAMLGTHEGEHAPGHIDAIVKTLKAGDKGVTDAKLSNDSIEYYAVLNNVENGVNQLRTSDPILNEKYEDGSINIVGAIYNIETGKVDFFDF